MGFVSSSFSPTPMAAILTGVFSSGEGKEGCGSWQVYYRPHSGADSKGRWKTVLECADTFRAVVVLIQLPVFSLLLPSYQVVCVVPVGWDRRRPAYHQLSRWIGVCSHILRHGGCWKRHTKLQGLLGNCSPSGWDAPSASAAVLLWPHGNAMSLHCSWNDFMWSCILSKYITVFEF